MSDFPNSSDSEIHNPQFGFGAGSVHQFGPPPKRSRDDEPENSQLKEVKCSVCGKEFQVDHSEDRSVYSWGFGTYTGVCSNCCKPIMVQRIHAENLRLLGEKAEVLRLLGEKEQNNHRLRNIIKNVQAALPGFEL